jgi:crotonobetainyl-CoA:carnitine CoA-transferase CaiB-like acyl-CoA transferase
MRVKSMARILHTAHEAMLNLSIWSVVDLLGILAMDMHSRPLDGIKVVEFTHMVMGPAMGVILADLGANIIKVEPLKGDNTRRLSGAGAGYFPMYNRNKRSLCIDTASEAGKKVINVLLDRADVFIENFRPGGMAESGWDYATLSARHPRLICCSAKGFLKGPYAQRTALDEVAQMMGGLAYMTGLPGKPMRAGASVIDVTGGMFGVIGILAALEQRHRTGRGQEVKTSLFETTAFLVGQHMAQYAVTGKPAPPMSQRLSAWAVYDIFETADSDQVFIGVVSDTQWRKFCEAFELQAFAQDRSLDQNGERVKQRERIMGVLRERFRQLTKADLMAQLEAIGLPFAPVTKPEELFNDKHLNAADGLIEITLPDGKKTKLPSLPIEMQGERLGVYRDLPRAGQHTHEVLQDAGFSLAEIADLVQSGVIAKQDKA